MLDLRLLLQHCAMGQALQCDAMARHSASSLLATWYAGIQPVLRQCFYVGSADVYTGQSDTVLLITYCSTANTAPVTTCTVKLSSMCTVYRSVRVAVRLATKLSVISVA